MRSSLLLCIGIVYVLGNLYLDRWQKNFYAGDTNGYYLHLVSALIYQDVGDYNPTVDAMLASKQDLFDPRQDEFLIRQTEVGRKYIKYTLGVPIMEAPFFLLGHLYALNSEIYPADGWSLPYFFSVGLATTAYILIGFYLLIGVLARYYSERVVILTTLSIALGTNLFFHATYMTMAHGFLFANYCLLIYLSDRFYRRPGWLIGLFVGCTIGLITLCRVPEIVSAFIPLFWGITNWKSLGERFTFFQNHYQTLLAALIGFLFLLSIQMGYWYYTSGQLVFNPYDGEGFDFTNPRILKGWFHIANGWLVYTPIMGFGLLGLLFIRRHSPGVLWPTLLFVGFHAYIHYCYYVFTYFPGLGNRPMVETYAIFSFGMAAFYSEVLKRKWATAIVLPLILFFTGLNFFQTWQMNEGIIWSERHNDAFYLETFGRTTSTMDALRAYDTGEVQPDIDRIVLVKRLYFNDFENANLPQVSSDFKWSGEFALFPFQPEYEIEEEVSLSQVSPGDWLKLGMETYAPMVGPVLARDNLATFILQFFDETGKNRRFIAFKPGTHVENPTGNIWITGGLNNWEQAYVFIKVPRAWNDKWYINLHTVNHHHQHIYLDDLYLEHYRKRGG